MWSSIFPIPALPGRRWPVAVHMLHMIYIVVYTREDGCSSSCAFSGWYKSQGTRIKDKVPRRPGMRTVMVIHPFQAWRKEWKSMAGMWSSIFPIPGLGGSRSAVAVHLLHMIVIVQKVPRRLEMRMVIVIRPFQAWRKAKRSAYVECGRAFFPFQSSQAFDDM